MHRSLTLLVFYFCFIPFSWSQVVAARDSLVMEQVRKTEGRLSGILEKNDVDALDSLLHPGFTVQSSEGNLVRKAQLLKGFRSGQNPYLKFRPKASSVVIVDENTVISSGNELYAHKAEGKTSQDETRFFYHVWIREGQEWRLAGRIIAEINGH